MYYWIDFSRYYLHNLETEFMMYESNALFSFPNSSIDFKLDFEREEDEEDRNCLCGPKPCRSDVIDTDELSLSTADEAEVVNVSLWESILRQSDDEMAPYRDWLKGKTDLEPAGIPQYGPAEFLEEEIFPVLLPAMRIMLMQARDWDALDIQKCRFNGLDFLAEFLWNRNPRHPKRSQSWLELFSIPPFRLFLKLNPRPIFPKSWLWSREEGAVMIQKWVRGWLVRKREDVQEMRLFWKAVIAESEKEAAELGITYSELLENRSKERNTPCERYRDK